MTFSLSSGNKHNRPIGRIDIRLLLASGLLATAFALGVFALFAHTPTTEPASLTAGPHDPVSMRHMPKASIDDLGSNENRFKNKGNRTTPTPTPKFTALTPTEQSDNIQRRLSCLRDDLSNSTNPEIIIKNLLKDIDSMNSLQKRAFCGTVEDELADVSSDSENKLAWLASMLPKITDSLKENKVYSRTSLNHLFSILGHNLEMMKVDPYAEIIKLPEGPVRRELLEGLLPQQIISKSEDYRSMEDRIPSESVPQFHQNILDESAASGSYATQALGLYLDGKGTSGEHPELAASWFSDREWLKENSDQIRDLVKKSAVGSRRDLVIMNILKRTDDPEEYSGWAELISDKSKLQGIHPSTNH